MLKGCIFDMDGLLFDTERLYRDTWIILAEEAGLTPDPAFPKAVCGSSGEHMLNIIRTYYPEVDPVHFQQECLQRVDAQLEREVPCKPGLFEILEGMRSCGVRMAVASSNPVPAIRRNLDNAGITDYFDVIVSGVDVPAGKPAPDVFLAAADRLGLEPAACYVFEDSTNGIKAGHAAGCKVIMIPDLTEPNDDLRRLCTGIFPTLADAFRALSAPFW